MYVEIHILQNFAPNCLNRDDTNSPKDCVFGGYRRARLSSQCLKRAVRTHVRDAGLLADNNLARRTKRAISAIANKFSEVHNRNDADASAKTAAALASQGLTQDTKNPQETQYLLFLGEREIDGLAQVVNDHWDDIEALPVKKDEEKKPKGRGSKKAEALKDVKDAVLNILDGGRAADLALFGRMLADLPSKNVDAAAQVAHAISTNAVSMEMDYFTAVDDLKDASKEGEDAGAGMLGTVEFNSACYYRYANVHVPQLVQNLQGDTELAENTIRAFIKASSLAIPTGKQNSFAAHNPPSLIFVTVRSDAPWALTNAFAKPIESRYSNGNLIGQSIIQLDKYWGHTLQGLR